MKMTRRTSLRNVAAVGLGGALLPFTLAGSPLASTIDKLVHPNAMQKPKLLIFDVNETLLDLSGIKESVNKALDHEFAFNQWFALLLQYSLVDTVTTTYHDFGTIGKAAMQMTQEKLGRSIPESKVEELIGMIKNLSPHPDVKPALDKLKKAGYRMITLTNSPPEVVTQQMQAAGLTEYFELLLSIESTRRYKPHPDTYAFALQKTGVNPGEAMLIAAHGWDIAGALRAGLQTGFIGREGQVLYPLAPKPQMIGKTLAPIAENLVAL